MSRRSGEVPAIGNAQEQDDEYRRDLRSYLCGISLALPVTVASALVYWSAMPRFGLLLAIGAFALEIVHFRFFLHIDPPRQKVDDLQLILFSGLILLVMAGGTIWIMANLAMGDDVTY